MQKLKFPFNDISTRLQEDWETDIHPLGFQLLHSNSDHWVLVYIRISSLQMTISPAAVPAGLVSRASNRYALSRLRGTGALMRER
jgi:hypothetical protein